MDELDSKSLCQVVDQYKQKIGDGVIVLATAADNKVALAVGITDSVSKTVKAGDYIKVLAAIVGGKGGGRPDFAQAGGQDVSQVDALIQQAPTLLEGLLS